MAVAWCAWKAGSARPSAHSFLPPSPTSPPPPPEVKEEAGKRGRR